MRPLNIKVQNSIAQMVLEWLSLLNKLQVRLLIVQATFPNGYFEVTKIIKKVFIFRLLHKYRHHKPS